MPTIDDILSNKELADDFEITLGDKGSFKLGDLRNQYTSLRTERDSFAQERDGYRGKYEEINGTVSKLLGEADRRATAEIEQPAPADPKEVLRDAFRGLLEPVDPSTPLFEDKMFGRALSRVREEAIREAEARFKPLSDKYEALERKVADGLTAAGNAFAYERENRWYADNRNDIPKGQDGKRYSVDRLRQYATQNGMYVQGTQLVDYDKALDTLTAPLRREQEIDKARKEAYEEGVRAARTASGKGLPMFGDRAAGGMGGEQPKFDRSKSVKQNLSERIGRAIDEDIAGNE